MKKFFSHMMIMVTSLMAIVACQQTPQPDQKPDPGKDPDTNPEELTITDIYCFGSATEAGWDVEKMTAFTNLGGGLYSWTGYLDAGAPFRFPLQRAEWPSLMIDEDGETLVLGKSDDDIIVYTVEQPGTWEIIIDARDIEHLTVSLDLVEMDMEKVEINELYILGEACPTGWALDLMEQLTNDNGVFTWEGALAANKRFRFPLQKIPDTWWPCLMLGENGKVLYGMGDDDEVNHPVDQDGVYEIVIDTRNRKDMKYTITLKSTEIPDPVIEHLYMLGDATPSGWALDAAPEMENNNQIFTWQGKLRAAGEFRMNTTNENWFPAIVIDIASGKPIYTASWDDTIHKMFSVDKDGIYKVTVNLQVFKELSVNVEFISETEPEPEPEFLINELYMLGDATVTGWSIDDMEAFTKDGRVFTWSGTLKAAGGFRFLTQKVGGAWFPAVAKEIATGNPVYVADGAWDDTIYAHFTVPSDGQYTIVLDATDEDNLTCVIAPADPEYDGFITELYVLGDGCDTGWSIDAMEAFVGANGVFTWTGNLHAAGGVRFLTQKVPNAWFPAIAKEISTGNAVYVADGAWNDTIYAHFTVAEDGVYEVVVTAKTKDNITCVITKK